MVASKGGVSGAGVAVATAGVILAYSGLKGKSISRTMRDLLAGKNPSTDPTVDKPIVDTSSMPSLGRLLTPPGIPTGRPPIVAAPPATGRAKTNQAIAKPLAAALGWNENNGQWQALVQLWNNESGWSNTAYNPSSGATGIPQAVPASKLPPAGQAPYFDARVQIVWGLAYIKGAYGSPSAALTFWNRTDPRCCNRCVEPCTKFPGHWY